MMFPSIGRKIQPEPDAPAIAADSMSLAVEPSVTFQPQANSAAPLTPPDLTNLDDLMTDAPTTFEPTVPQTSSVSFDMSSDEKPVLDLDLSNSSTAVNSIDDDAKTADSETDATTNVGSVASSESDLPATPAVLTTGKRHPRSPCSRQRPRSHQEASPPRPCAPSFTPRRRTRRPLPDHHVNAPRF
jgi:hypothetical protein